LKKEPKSKLNKFGLAKAVAVKVMKIRQTLMVFYGKKIVYDQ